MSENNVSRRPVATIKRRWWARLLDFSAYLSASTLIIGWGTTPADSWRVLAFAVPGVLLAMTATELIGLHRKRHEKLRVAAVLLVRALDSGDRSGAEYACHKLPAEVLAEARKDGEVADA